MPEDQSNLFFFPVKLARSWGRGASGSEVEREAVLVALGSAG